MKLATLKSGGRDGTLVVVSKDLTQYAVVGSEAPTLQSALDNWQDISPLLRTLSDQIAAGAVETQSLIQDS